MAEAEGQKLSLARTISVSSLAAKLKRISVDSKKVVRQMSEESGLGEDIDENDLDLEGKPEVFEEKYQNLIKRQKTYGDITQNASPEELENLLRYHENNVPEVILALEKKILMNKRRKYTPPAFFCRDGSFIQPPTF